MTCPTCSKPMLKVIMTGLPMKLCSDENCGRVGGYWALLMPFLPFTGYFLEYDGNYFAALWYWLTTKEDE